MSVGVINRKGQVTPSGVTGAVATRYDLVSICESVVQSLHSAEPCHTTLQATLQLCTYTTASHTYKLHSQS